MGTSGSGPGQHGPERVGMDGKGCIQSQWPLQRLARSYALRVVQGQQPEKTFKILSKRLQKAPWLLFLLLNLAIFASYGIRLGGDSPRYIDGAVRLLSNQPLAANQVGYYGYIAVIALNQALGLDNAGVVLLQLLVSAFALYCLYSLGDSLAGPP